MTFYTSTTAATTTSSSFATTNATTAPTFHASCTKRGCNAMDSGATSFALPNEERSHKRIKISSSEPTTGLFGGSSYHHQPQAFQAAPIPFASSPYSAGSTCFTYGNGESQTKKRRA